MKNLLASAAMLLMSAAAAQAATLNMFDASISADGGPVLASVDNTPIIAGAELVLSDVSGPTVSLDMTAASTFTLSYDLAALPGLPIATAWVIDDFQFDLPGAVVTSVMLTGGDASLVTVTTNGTSITVNVADFTILPLEIKTFDFSFTSTPNPPTVPLPASLPLLAGALGLGGLLTRRRKG